MDKARVINRLNIPYFLIKITIGGIFCIVMAMLFGKYGFLFFISLLFIFYLFLRRRRFNTNIRRQKSFMMKRSKVRSVDLDCGRWGDFFVVDIFGVNLAADVSSPEEIKEMIFDVVRIIRGIEYNGKLPKGKLFSEEVANLVSGLGFDAQSCKWKCESEILSDISYLVGLGYGKEPQSMSEWVSVIQHREKSENRTVYNSSFIVRVIRKVESLAIDMQIENIKAGGIVVAE